MAALKFNFDQNDIQVIASLMTCGLWERFRKHHSAIASGSHAASAWIRFFKTFEEQPPVAALAPTRKTYYDALCGGQPPTYILGGLGEQAMLTLRTSEEVIAATNVCVNSVSRREDGQSQNQSSEKVRVVTLKPSEIYQEHKRICHEKPLLYNKKISKAINGILSAETKIEQDDRLAQAEQLEPEEMKNEKPDNQGRNNTVDDHHDEDPPSKRIKVSHDDGIAVVCGGGDQSVGGDSGKLAVDGGGSYPALSGGEGNHAVSGRRGASVIKGETIEKIDLDITAYFDFCLFCKDLK